MGRNGRVAPHVATRRPMAGRPPGARQAWGDGNARLHVRPKSPAVRDSNDTTESSQKCDTRAVNKGFTRTSSSVKRFCESGGSVHVRHRRLLVSLVVASGI